MVYHHIYHTTELVRLPKISTIISVMCRIEQQKGLHYALRAQEALEGLFDGVASHT
jgi:hypothetical protein